MIQIHSTYRSKDIVLQSCTYFFTKILDPVLNGPECVDHALLGIGQRPYQPCVVPHGHSNCV